MKKRKFACFLSEVTHERIERLQVATDADTKTEVVRRALKLQEDLIKHSNDGVVTVYGGGKHYKLTLGL